MTENTDLPNWLKYRVKKVDVINGQRVIETWGDIISPRVSFIADLEKPCTITIEYEVLAI